MASSATSSTADVSPSIPDNINGKVLSSSSSSSAIKTNIPCDDILLGVWFETCFLVSSNSASSDDGSGSGNGVAFPSETPQEGMFSFPIVIVRAAAQGQENDGGGGGVDLYGYSIRNSFLGRKNYWELGHGTPSRVPFPTSTTNCVAHFKSKLMLRDDNDEKWDVTMDDGYYYWNNVGLHDDDGRLVFVGNGKGATCRYRRLYGRECREVVETAITQFAQINVTLSSLLPNKRNLCAMTR